MWWEKKQERQRARREGRFLQRHENRATQTDVVVTAKAAAKTQTDVVTATDVGTQTGPKRPNRPKKTIVEAVQDKALRPLTESDEEVTALMGKRYCRYDNPRRCCVRFGRCCVRCCVRFARYGEAIWPLLCPFFFRPALSLQREVEVSNVKKGKGKPRGKSKVPRKNKTRRRNSGLLIGSFCKCVCRSSFLSNTCRFFIFGEGRFGRVGVPNEPENCPTAPLVLISTN